MIPISHNNEITIPIAVLSKSLQSLLENFLPAIMVLLISITFVFSTVANL